MGLEPMTFAVTGQRYQPAELPSQKYMQLFTLRSSCRTVYFISTIISGDDGQGVIRHPCRTSHISHLIKLVYLYAQTIITYKK